MHTVQSTTQSSPRRICLVSLKVAVLCQDYTTCTVNIIQSITMQCNTQPHGTILTTALLALFFFLYVMLTIKRFPNNIFPDASLFLLFIIFPLTVVFR